MQASGGFFACLGRCVVNSHEFLHRGRDAASVNGASKRIVPGGEA
jgi:hypothetical protein